MKRFFRDINEFHFEGMKVAFVFHEIFTIVFTKYSKKFVNKRNKRIFFAKIIIRTSVF